MTDSKTQNMSENKPENKPENKSENKPEINSEINLDINSEIKSELTSDLRSPLLPPSPPLLVSRILAPLNHGSQRSSIFTLVGTALGAAVIAMPYCAAKIGVISVIFINLIFVIGSFFGLYVIAATLKDRNLHTYSDLVKCCGPHYPIVLDLFVTINCIGASISYMILQSQLSPSFFLALGLSYPYTSRTLHLTIAVVIMWALSCVERIGDLRYLSIVPTIAQTIAILFLIVKSCKRMLHDTSIIYRVSLIQLNWNIPTTFNVIMFAYQQHMSLCIVVDEMNDPTPRRFTKTILKALTFEFTLYILVSLAGGVEMTKHVKQNFLLLYPPDDIFAAVCRFIVSISFVVNVAFNLVPASRSLNRVLKVIGNIFRDMCCKADRVDSVYNDRVDSVYNDREYNVYNDREYNVYNDREYNVYNDREYNVYNDRVDSVYDNDEVIDSCEYVVRCDPREFVIRQINDNARWKRYVVVEEVGCNVGQYDADDDITTTSTVPVSNSSDGLSQSELYEWDRIQPDNMSQDTETLSPGSRIMSTTIAVIISYCFALNTTQIAKILGLVSGLSSVPLMFGFPFIISKNFFFSDDDSVYPIKPFSPTTRKGIKNTVTAVLFICCALGAISTFTVILQHLHIVPSGTD